MISVAAAAQSIETFSRWISETRLIWGSTAKGLIFAPYRTRVNVGRQLTPRTAGRRKAGESPSSNRECDDEGPARSPLR